MANRQGGLNAFLYGYQPEDPVYAVGFPNFPEIITSGATLTEAFSKPCEARSPRPCSARFHES